MDNCPLSIVIPTFNRGRIVLDTIKQLFEQVAHPEEIIVVDQTRGYENAIETEFSSLSSSGQLIRITLPEPSIPKAMNIGLLAATQDVVLFLDDDIKPSPDLTQQHVNNYADPDIVAVVGRVTQSGSGSRTSVERQTRGAGMWTDLDFDFDGSTGTVVSNCMAGNLSVRRQAAIQAGGFDESFSGAAYRFETEFCRRLQRNGGVVYFDPGAHILHLQAPCGGTRSYGNPLKSASPVHSVGDYYFALREGKGPERLIYIVYRLFRSIRTRFHLFHPWWIPVKLTGEIRGLAKAFLLSRRAPQYVVPSIDE